MESQLAASKDHISEGAKIRSRAQWLEQGERPTRFFFKLEKERVQHNHVKDSIDRHTLRTSLEVLWSTKPPFSS